MGLPTPRAWSVGSGGAHRCRHAKVRRWLSRRGEAWPRCWRAISARCARTNLGCLLASLALSQHYVGSLHLDPDIRFICIFDLSLLDDAHWHCARDLRPRSRARCKMFFFFFAQTPNSCGIFQAQYVCVNPNYACKFMQGTYVRDPVRVEVDGGSL